DSVIQKIRAKCEAIRTCDHSSQKHDYLFSGIIYDMETGYTLSGTPNSEGKGYYRPHSSRSNRYMINADVIEHAVLDILFKTLGRNKDLFDAVFDGAPMKEVIDKLAREKDTYKTQLSDIDRKIKNYTKAIREYEGEDLKYFLKSVESEIKDLEKEHSAIKFQIDTIDNQLKTR
ncbi:MAG: hypothetical protein ACXU9J_10875, partial [Syntrophales bacterium]